MPYKAHRAKFILAESGRLIQNAELLVSASGRISGVRRRNRDQAGTGAKVADWGSAVIVPGLVNAHAHLELSSLHSQIMKFNSFTDWISQLIRRRSQWTADDYGASALRGAQLCLASGTTLAGDITSAGTGWEAARGAGLRRVVFEEVVGIAPDRADQTLLQASRLFDEAAADPLAVHGISPHAPYSVSADLYSRAASLARDREMILTTHAAETEAELMFLQNGEGELRDFLVAMRALPQEWKVPGSHTIPYLHGLGVLGPRCLLAHCNYLDRASIRCIRRTLSSVVYCPRSHDFFGHKKHPVRQLLDSGVNVALGTDSLASNFSLSMLDEMRFLYKKRKDLKPGEIFDAATRNGAAALGFRGILGVLRRGYLADMAVLALPQNTSPRHLVNQILEGSGECIASIVQGRTAWRKSEINPANK
jgi:cytosine/adenosine deaminase-related metal-dependent hydrolase